MQTQRIKLFIAGVLGLIFTYFMPQIGSFLVGFEGVQASPGFLTDMTNLMMVLARLCCAIYSMSLIFSSFSLTGRKNHG